MLFVATSEIMSSRKFQTIEIRELSHVIYYTQAVLDMCVVVCFPFFFYVCMSLNVGSDFCGSYSVICLLSWFRFGKYLDVISPKTKMLSETVSTNHQQCAFVCRALIDLAFPRSGCAVRTGHCVLFDSLLLRLYGFCHGFSNWIWRSYF